MKIWQAYPSVIPGGETANKKVQTNHHGIVQLQGSLGVLLNHFDYSKLSSDADHKDGEVNMIELI
jgi:hypothetical protein